MKLSRRLGSELTQIKCYRDWAVDEGPADTLTHNHGYLYAMYGIAVKVLE